MMVGDKAAGDGSKALGYAQLSVPAFTSHLGCPALWHPGTAPSQEASSHCSSPCFTLLTSHSVEELKCVCLGTILPMHLSRWSCSHPLALGVSRWQLHEPLSEGSREASAMPKGLGEPQQLFGAPRMHLCPWEAGGREAGKACPGSPAADDAVVGASKHVRWRQETSPGASPAVSITCL